MMHIKYAFCLVLCICLGCDGSDGPASADEQELTTAVPFPIDRGGTGSAPATYKGLTLGLTDNGDPVVTAVDGVIGLVCIGMSNANMECADFQRRHSAEFAGTTNPAVRVVNCAVGGNAIERWNDAMFDATLWQRCVTQQIPAAGLRIDQVRVIWHKAANQFTTASGGGSLPGYPAAGSDYEAFLENLGTFAARVPSFFPNVQAVYTTSRSYGGYAGSAARGEPLSYEEGHALNTWLRSNRFVNGVWYGWGPYIWAGACTNGEPNAAGVCYDRADYVTDGVHPSASGQAKISRQLHDRLLTESWYRRN
jgi:hypothetical protein